MKIDIYLHLLYYLHTHVGTNASESSEFEIKSRRKKYVLGSIEFWFLSEEYGRYAYFFNATKADVTLEFVFAHSLYNAESLLSFKRLPNPMLINVSSKSGGMWKARRKISL